MISFLIAAIGSTLVLLFASYLQLRLRAVTEYAAAAAAFFRAAETMTSCDEAPPELLDALSAMNETVSDRRAARSMLSYLSADARWRDMNSDAFLRRKKVLTEFFERRPELERTYHEIVVDWFLAITALSPVVGKLARIAMTGDAVEAAAGARRHPRGDAKNLLQTNDPQTARA
jgi:hypothetical protein